MITLRASAGDEHKQTRAAATTTSLDNLLSNREEERLRKNPVMEIQVI